MWREGVLVAAAIGGVALGVDRLARHPEAEFGPGHMRPSRADAGRADQLAHDPVLRAAQLREFSMLRREQRALRHDFKALMTPARVMRTKRVPDWLPLFERYTDIFERLQVLVGFGFAALDGCPRAVCRRDVTRRFIHWKDRQFPPTPERFFQGLMHAIDLLGPDESWVTGTLKPPRPLGPAEFIRALGDYEELLRLQLGQPGRAQRGARREGV